MTNSELILQDGVQKLEIQYDWAGTIGQWKTADQKTPNFNDVLCVTHTHYGWDISLNVGDFRPDEIHAYILKNELFIDCKHKAKSDEIGYLTREMLRVIKIPGDVHNSSISIFLYPSGLLAIKGSKLKH